MKKYYPMVIAAAFAAGFAGAGPIATWVTGDALTAADINANFSHIHNTMVGGHGPRLVNSDVASNAAIAHTKLAVPTLVPKAWSIVANCTSSPCTQQQQYGVGSVTRQDAGVYTVNWTSPRVDGTYAPFLTSTGANAFKHCAITSYGAANVTVGCIEVSSDGGVSAFRDNGFSILLMDNNN